MVKNDDYVVIHYTGTFTDGEVFDTSQDRDPLEFQVGTGMVIPGLEKAMIGMTIDEEKDITISPEEAYGDHDENLVYTFPIEEIRSQFEPEIGMVIGVQLEDGRQVPAEIVEIGAEDVRIDLNHPLAGKTLNFHIKLVEINDEPKYGGGCDCCDHDSGSGCSC